LDGLGRGIAEGALQRQTLGVLRDGGHLCDLNGQFIRAMDELGDGAIPECAGGLATLGGLAALKAIAKAAGEVKPTSNLPWLVSGDRF
jgi:hypothetical protein